MEMKESTGNPLLESHEVVHGNVTFSKQMARLKTDINKPYKFKDDLVDYMGCKKTSEVDTGDNMTSHRETMDSLTPIQPPRLRMLETKDRVKVVRRRSSIFFIALIILALLIGVIGSLLTGFFGYYYSISEKRELLNINTRIALNSTAEALANLKHELVKDSIMFSKYTKMIESSFSTDWGIRRAYNASFARLASLTLALTGEMGTYSLYVSFCGHTDEKVTPCDDVMMLSYACNAFPSEPMKCFYFVTRDGGVDKFEILQDDHGLTFQMVWIDFSIPERKPVIFNKDHEGYVSRYIECTSHISGIDTYEGITYQLSFASHGRSVVIEATSYTNTWFSMFSLGVSPRYAGYSFIFDLSGKILSDSCGREMYNKKILDASEGQRFLSRGEAQCKECINGALEEILLILKGHYINRKMGPFSETKLDKTTIGFYTENDSMPVAVQDFLELGTNSAGNRTLFVAHLTPSSISIDRDDTLQITTCVVVIFVSIFILGGITLFSIKQLQRTLELVSILTVHVTAYDWEGMQKVIEENHSCCMSFGRILGTDLLLEEFVKILLNLKTYRPFLPQAFLSDIPRGVRDLSLTECLSGRTSFLSNEGSRCEILLTPVFSEKSCMDSCNMEMTPNLVDHQGLGEEKEKEQSELNIAVELVSSLKRVNGTVVVVQLHGCLFQHSTPLAVIDCFLSTVLKYAKRYGGVADEIAADHVIITFNLHISVLRHQQKACQCAMSIQEDCKRAELEVVIAITSGVNYIGTVGTEEQKAHVLVGDGVDLGRRMVTLDRYLGATILVTQEVAHESGAATVPVDNIQVCLPFQNTIAQHVILEVVALNHNELSFEYTIAKRLFNLVLTRQGGEALKMVTQFTRSFASMDEVPWFARRMHQLCTRNMKLVERGYRRKELLWDPIEGEESLLELYKRREGALCIGEPRYTTEASAKIVHGLLSFPEMNLKTNGLVGHHPDDVERAREEIDAQSYSSHHGVQMKKKVQGEDALISLFITDDRNWPDDEGPIEQGTLIVSNSISCRPPLPRRIEDIKQQVFYRTDELLGRGKFGEVYLAISTNGGFVAAKVFPLMENSTVLVREVETLIQLRHDHILTYDSCAIQDGYFFIFTEYMASVNMRRLIKQLGRIPEKAARKYGRDILFGLKFLHTMNYVHCDIKPDNVLLSSEGTCKLGDFGTAQLNLSLCDKAATMRGTPRYMAPETLMGKWTIKADIYSFGLTMSHMLLGYNPWHRYVEPDEHFLLRLARDASELRPEIPTDLEDKELERAVQSCCEFDPELRPTVDALLALLS